MGLKIRRDTAANWASNNPTIEAGEQTVETDTGKVKWNRSASGVAYNSLAYYSTNDNSTPGGGDVTGQSSSVDSEVALFSSTTGKVIKRSTLTGVPKQASGVQSGTAATINDLGSQTADYSANSHKITNVTDPGAAQDAATQNYVLGRKVTDLTAPTSDFSMNSHKITSVTDPASAQDAATKNYVDTRLYVSELTSTATLSNNNADTVLWTATNVAAAALVAGTTCFHFRLGGTLDNAATSGQLDMKLKINTTLVVTVGLISASQTNAASGTPYSVAGSIFVDTIGGSGVVTIIGDSVCLTTAGGGQNPRPFMATSSAISLTGGLQLTVTGDWVTAALSNTLRLNRAVMNQVA